MATDSSAINQRSQTALCVVIVTDEPSNADANTQADVISALNGGGATLFGVLPGANSVRTSYEPVINATGGGIFSLADLVDNTDSVVAQIGLGCAEAIIRQVEAEIPTTTNPTAPAPEAPVVQHPTTPVVQGNCVDSDGDGWGWDGKTSCRVGSSASVANNSSSCVDDDGDGWGWDGSKSCLVISMQTCVDADGDG